MIKHHYDLSVVEALEHAALYGGYNDFPPNWTELTAADFAKSDYFGWYPLMVEHRQMIPRTPEMIDLMATKTGPKGCVVSNRLEWMPSGYCYCIVNDFWGGTIRYFRGGTQHANWLKGVDSSD